MVGENIKEHVVFLVAQGDFDWLHRASPSVGSNLVAVVVYEVKLKINL